MLKLKPGNIVYSHRYNTLKWIGLILKVKEVAKCYTVYWIKKPQEIAFFVPNVEDLYYDHIEDGYYRQ
jgi:hypothetical protein